LSIFQLLDGKATDSCDLP